MTSAPACAGRNNPTFSPTLGEKVFLCPAGRLKKSAGCVLASLGRSTYAKKYASHPRSLRPCRTDILNRLPSGTGSNEVGACPAGSNELPGDRHDRR